jgi:hypothetical protein
VDAINESVFNHSNGLRRLLRAGALIGEEGPRCEHSARPRWIQPGRDDGHARLWQRPNSFNRLGAFFCPSGDRSSVDGMGVYARDRGSTHVSNNRNLSRRAGNTFCLKEY